MKSIIQAIVAFLIVAAFGLIAIYGIATVIAAAVHH